MLLGVGVNMLLIPLPGFSFLFCSSFLGSSVYPQFHALVRASYFVWFMYLTRASLPTWLLDLHGKLLQVKVVGHVGVDGLTDESGALGAVLLRPLGVVLLLGLDGLLLWIY